MAAASDGVKMEAVEKAVRRIMATGELRSRENVLKEKARWIFFGIMAATSDGVKMAAVEKADNGGRGIEKQSKCAKREGEVDLFPDNGGRGIEKQSKCAKREGWFFRIRWFV